jgi:galactose oxidase
MGVTPQEVSSNEVLLVQDSKVSGQWSAVFELPNVAIHAHILPTGKVLMWGRRDHPADSLDVHECTPFVWDPATEGVSSTPQPKLADGQAKVNLFCSGHVFLPDGRLLVIGGHQADGEGLDQASIYDPIANAWSATATMNAGRWYPTAVALPDGSVLASSGNFRSAQGQSVNNNIQQIWSNGAWHSIVDFGGLPLYPRMHVIADGRVFMSGHLAQTYFLDTSGQGMWMPLSNGVRASLQRDYAPSVMYDVGKIIFIGGGNNPGTGAPTNAVEVIDLNAPAPLWQFTGSMKFPRRQHNAAILPNGTVLVTGGTRGGGGPNNGFNDLAQGQPVHTSELWDLATGQWTQLADEDIDRCYHATTVLLPDGRVLSAGGGEYRPDNVHDNAPKDSHRDAQIFSPPYLFKGPRPVIASAPGSVTYGENFAVELSAGNDIAMASWIRLPSVTHSFDQNQRINFLTFKSSGQTITITAPPTTNLCPPGHYMLFLLNKAGVPSIAEIIKIAPAPIQAYALLNADFKVPEAHPPNLMQRDAQLVAGAHGTAVTVGVTPTCPYGLSACWGGAFEALSRLPGVDFVRPIANAEDSVAYLYLRDFGLPDLEEWPAQFAATANGTYLLRGVELELSGAVEAGSAGLFLEATSSRPAVALAPLQACAKIQWDHSAREPRPFHHGEKGAFDRLAHAQRAVTNHAFANQSVAVLQATITGPLSKTAAAFVLQVREFKAGEES